MPTTCLTLCLFSGSASTRARDLDGAGGGGGGALHPRAHRAPRLRPLLPPLDGGPRRRRLRPARVGDHGDHPREHGRLLLLVLQDLLHFHRAQSGGDELDPSDVVHRHRELQSSPMPAASERGDLRRVDHERPHLPARAQLHGHGDESRRLPPLLRREARAIRARRRERRTPRARPGKVELLLEHQPRDPDAAHVDHWPRSRSSWRWIARCRQTSGRSSRG